MAHRKAGGAAKNVRDSKPKYLGVKLYDGQQAKAGSIIVRQRGTKFTAGTNVKIGHDHTLFSTINGTVKFAKKRKSCFTGAEKIISVVSVLPTK